MPLQIGYGLVAAQRPPFETRPWSALYADALACAEAAEAAGFDSVWVTEHHFTPDGYLASLFPMLAAMATRTSRVLLGTNVALAPLYQPVRLAEDALAVDALSGGRLLLGLGIGYRDEEFLALGVPKAERVARILECVKVCRAAFSGAPVTVGEGVEVTVLPQPDRALEIWLGGWVDAAVRRADHYADGYISPVGDLADTERRVGMLSPATGIATTTFVALHDGTLPPEIERSLRHVFESYGEWYGSSSDDAGGREVARLVDSILAAPDVGAFVLGGHADDVIAALTPLAAAFAKDRTHHLVVRMHHPGVPLETNLDQIHRFARDVLPALRDLTS